MARFAVWVTRASYVLYAAFGVLALLVMAAHGYWGVFFPFLVVFVAWAWWTRTHPPDFR